MKVTSGRFIVFEGLDGSGKATQAKLLAEHFKKEGFEIEKIDFPQHGEPSAYFVDAYLIGKYGTAEAVGPYIGSTFYSLDRYDASFKIKKWLDEGRVIIADRYTASNIGHQGGKIESEKERSEYFEWLFNLEYNLFKIPKPDVNFILKTSPELSLVMAGKTTDASKIERRESYLGNGKEDIHEKDKDHQSKTLESYLQVAKEYPQDFKIIECVKNNNLLSPEEIHNKVWEELKQIYGI